MAHNPKIPATTHLFRCLLYTSDAADERSSVDLGGRRIIKKKNTNNHSRHIIIHNTMQNNKHTI